jgi:hypothetical protein
MQIKNMNDDDDIYIGGPKDYDEQTDAFRFDLDDMIDRYLEEFDLNVITIIGALQEKVEQLSNSGDIEFEMDDDFFDE